MHWLEDSRISLGRMAKVLDEVSLNVYYPVRCIQGGLAERKK
jgi:hypothetical protein